MKHLLTTRWMCRGRTGSALILTVVLTSLLAIVGVLFLMVSRMDQITSSAASANKDLDLAVETVVGRLGDELVKDVPGVAGQEYYDYAGPDDVWLASIEPNDSQMWQQISDLTGYLSFRGWATNNVAIDSSEPNVLFKPVIPQDRPIALHSNGALLEQLADADGDGIADSKWFELDNVSSTKGRPVYAAVRVIDNGGMLNVNTGLGFNPYDPNIQSRPSRDVDGSSQLHVNIMALAGPRRMPPRPGDRSDLLLARVDYGQGVDPNNLFAYERNVLWSFQTTTGYTPFDISDELELRYRFLVNHSAIDTRIEDWGTEFRSGTIMTPVEQGGKAVDDWFKRASDDGGLDPNYAFRHIATAFSVDRIINPVGSTLNNGRMVNVNDYIYDSSDKYLLAGMITQALLDANPAMLDAADRGAQIAANIIDYVDGDSEVTFIDANSTSYNGFEQPCVYISEIACNVVTDTSGNTYRSYAIELFKPYSTDPRPNSNEWELVIDGNPIPVTWTGSPRFHVMRNQDPQAPLQANYTDPENPGRTGTPQSISGYTFTGQSNIYLQRKVRGVGVVVDAIIVPNGDPASGWLQANAGPHSIERDISKHKCIRKLWANAGQAGASSLGSPNTYRDNANAGIVQAHPANRPLTCIGEIGMILAASGYNVPAGSTETDLLLDLRNPIYARIFNYLTVIDPSRHNNPVQETRVKGRININTAPWYVMEQLPWMSMNPAIARAVQAFRDTVAMGFRGTAEMMQVLEMGFYADKANLLTQGDQSGYPDLTYSTGFPASAARQDEAADDMEERDLIFHRISNLITVRSDVFTAYILVRVGADGPQRRVVAILDRSNVFSPADKPRILALHPVEDPR